MANCKPAFSFRQKVGACIYDLPRFVWAIRPWFSRRPAVSSWLFFRNRNEQLISGLNRMGVQCDWQWTSDLHITKVFPRLGQVIMDRALGEWSIGLQENESKQKENIGVSFIIGHRSVERLPHLLLTLKSIAAQTEVSVECILIEQSIAPQVKDHLPSWVRYVHTPLRNSDMAYSRAEAFNVGAHYARSEVLVMHDNDMLVPQAYAREILARVQDGYEVINLKRFVFYLDQTDSAAMFNGNRLTRCVPQTVVQNLEAGGSFAITREAYFEIGGFDESFVGWGGEDNEFWERAQTRKVWPYGYLPLVHLWHEAQPEKALMENAPAKERYWELAEIPPQTRIQILVNNNSNRFAKGNVRFS